MGKTQLLARNLAWRAAAQVLRGADAMQPSSYSDIIRRLRELGPFENDIQAAAALAPTLALLGAVLTTDDREALGRSLPVELAQDLYLSPPWAHPFMESDIPPVLALHEEAAMNQAIEHAEIVCRALGEILTPSARARLVQAVPKLARLLEPPAYVSPFSHEAQHSLAQPPKCGLQQEREARALAAIHPGWRRLLSST